MQSNNGIGVSLKTKSVSQSSYFDDYFYGIVDADLRYSIDLIGQTGIEMDNIVLLRLFSSIMCFPLINMEKHNSVVKKRNKKN